MGTSVNDMKSALSHGPVSVAIEADQKVFSSYHSGIIGSGCGTSLDHAVLIVGYDSYSGSLYWRVKNSWGSSWGEKGFVRIYGSACGIINNQAVYPKVSHSVVV